MPSPAACEAQSERSSSAVAADRFGVRLAGLPVLLPAGEMLEYLPEATIWQAPLAPARVAGLMQLRGHPVAVFDAARSRGDPAPARAAILVVGEPDRAAALIVDSPPRAVALENDRSARGEPEGDGGPAGAAALRANDDAGLEEALDMLAASVPFRVALDRPVRDCDGRRWWPVSTAMLFEALGGEPLEDGEKR